MKVVYESRDRQKRQIHLIPINKCMAIIVYLVYSLDEVVDIALKANFTSHFTADALFFG
jgi:hypothetical protein